MGVKAFKGFYEKIEEGVFYRGVSRTWFFQKQMWNTSHSIERVGTRSSQDSFVYRTHGCVHTFSVNADTSMEIRMRLS